MSDSRVRKHRLGMALLFGLIFVALAPTARTQEVLAPRDVAKLQSVVSVAMAPDGRHVAYELVVPRTPLEDEDGPAWVELHVVDAEGTSRPYVTGEVNVSQVAWMPDGERISFLAKREGDEHRSLYAIPLRGGEARKLLEHATDIRDYSWSSDGRRVAFLAEEKKPERVEELEKKGFNQIVYEENLRPVHLWIADVETSSEPRQLELEGSASSVHWSPVSERIALALAPTPLIDDSYMNRRVRVVDVETGQILARVDNPGKLGPIAWSPNGRFLAMISAADPHDPLQGRLMVVSAEGGELRDLLPDYDGGHVTSFAWKDDDTVLVSVDEGVWTVFGRVRREGSRLERMLPEEGPILSDVTISENGTAVALRGETSSHPREVFFVDLSGAGEPTSRRLTDSNPWLKDVTLAPQEVVRFRARDDLELEGILIHPLEERPQTRHPLILYVHGGPESHHSNGWLTSYSQPGQTAAAQGFAVFYINYRGSTGRGVAFSKLSQADAAGKEFDDLVDGVDHLIERGIVDRDKVGITGGSYGGYASAWGATYYSDRFAAAVMFVGISDNVSKMGTTDIPYEMYMVHHRKWVWEDWAYFRERSPIYYVERARTPILILAGEDDPRVHPSQSLELYRQLELLGQAPVRLVFYPGEGHGNRRAASRLDYNLRMLRWMEHYLKGPGGDPPPTELTYEPDKEEPPTDPDP